MRAYVVLLAVALTLGALGAGVAGADSSPPGPDATPASAPAPPSSTLTMDSFTTQPITTNVGPGYTFSFSAHWTRVPGANFYQLCFVYQEDGPPCPLAWYHLADDKIVGVGPVTLSYSAENLQDGYVFRVDGAHLITSIEFVVKTCSFPRGWCTYSNSITERIPAG